MKRTTTSLTLASLSLLLLSNTTFARDAAFMAPNVNGSNLSNEAVRIEPKNEIDVGETILNVSKRTTLFFVNQTTVPVAIEKMSINSDGNVRAEIVNDDCTKQTTIASQSRCSVEISVTPTTPGAWSVDTLMTHNGAGRISRGKLSGKTSGAIEDQSKREMSLAPTTKEATPISFGDVEAGVGKVVRSTLMVNDSPEPISLFSIDVIAAGDDLTRLDKGCSVDMELKPGESCPITLIWEPKSRASISTDLIIRHSGRVGFAVIPVRGNAKGDTVKTESASKDMMSKSATTKMLDLPPPPPSDINKAAIAASQNATSVLHNTTGTNDTVKTEGTLRLIGTIGSRAIILKPDGSTQVANVGDKLELDDKPAAVISVSSRSAKIVHDGKEKTLILETAHELTSKATVLPRPGDKPLVASTSEKKTETTTSITTSSTEAKK